MLLVTVGQDHVFHTSPGGGKVETWRGHLRWVVSEWPDQTTTATVLIRGGLGGGHARPQPLLQRDPREGPRSHLLAFSASETQGCSATGGGPASVCAGSWDRLSAATQADHPPASLTSVACQRDRDGLGDL